MRLIARLAIRSPHSHFCTVLSWWSMQVYLAGQDPGARDEEFFLVWWFSEDCKSVQRLLCLPAESGGTVRMPSFNCHVLFTSFFHPPCSIHHLTSSGQFDTRMSSLWKQTFIIWKLYKFSQQNVQLSSMTCHLVRNHLICLKLVFSYLVIP